MFFTLTKYVIHPRSVDVNKRSAEYARRKCAASDRSRNVFAETEGEDEGGLNEGRRAMAL